MLKESITAKSEPEYAKEVAPRLTDISQTSIDTEIQPEKWSMQKSTMYSKIEVNTQLTITDQFQ